MKRKIHRVLDGELSKSALTPEELLELEAFEIAIGTSRAADAAETFPDTSGTVMWRIAHLEPAPPPTGLAGRLLDRVRWLVQPQPVRLRPAVALAALVLALATGVIAADRDGASVATVEAGDSVRLLVQFRMSHEGATDVALIGDFSGWQRRLPLEEVAPGVWSTTVPLEPGIYDYAYVVDGETWTLDPLAPTVADGFGGSNSRLAVLAPEHGAGAL